MKKLAAMFCMACVFSSLGLAVNATEPVKPNEGIQQHLSKEEFVKIRKTKEAEFEQKLGLTDAQKQKARELRKQGFEKIKPVMNQIKDKKQEAVMVKRSKMAVQMQEERLQEIDNEIKALEKQASEIRHKNMKDFESILTYKQKRILKQMKKEGRKKYREGHVVPPPCPIEKK